MIDPQIPCRPIGLSQTPCSFDMCSASSVASMGLTPVLARVAERAPADAPDIVAVDRS